MFHIIAHIGLGQALLASTPEEMRDHLLALEDAFNSAECIGYTDIE
jgi:hypothetical protein